MPLAILPQAVISRPLRLLWEALNYDVTFPMMAKISVKGKDMAPLYQWLTEKKQNGKESAPVQWNFQKFMIDENGHWAGVVSPKESPFSEKIITWIEKE